MLGIGPEFREIRALGGMFKLVISDDEGKTTVVPLVRDEITIGRKEGNTIRLTERNVSRRHAKLVKENSAFTIEDLASYNGVKVNGRRIDGQVHLKAGDQLSIGDYLLALQLDTGEVAEAPTAAVPGPASSDAATAMISAPAEPRPPARLVMLTPPAPGAEFALSRPRQKVGRAEDLAIWVNHRSISREHAELVRDGEAFRLLDLGSANGVRVNGRDMSDAILEPGDVVELGQVRFRYVPEGEKYTFEADRTVQMDALAGPEPVSRAPIYAAVGIIVAAVGVAVVVALGGSGNSADPDQPMTVRSIEDESPAESSPSPAMETASPDQLAAECRSALERHDFTAAITAATSALRASPTHAGARACHDEAAAARDAQGTYDQGVRAWQAGDIESAAMTFATLPSGSSFFTRSPVPEALGRYAGDTLSEAERIADTDPEQAHHMLETLRTFPLDAAQARRADAIDARIAHRQAVAATNVPRTDDRGSHPRNPHEHPTGMASTMVETPRATPNNNTAPEASNGNALIDCASEANYSRCVITRIANPRTQRELAAVATAYQELNNTPRACQYMRRYVERYSDARAGTFSQFIQARCD